MKGNRIPWLLLVVAAYAPMKTKGATFTFEDGVIIDQHDCECINNEGGKFCGGSKFLKNLNNTGCRKGYLFTCTMMMKYPQDIDGCNDGYTCVVDDKKPGKGKCVPVPVGPKDCACKPPAMMLGGTFCGAEHSKYVLSMEGSGCRDDNVYNCTKGQPYAVPTKVCGDYDECVAEMPGKAKCAPFHQNDDCRCSNDKEAGYFCGQDKTSVSSQNNTLGCRVDWIYKCNAFGKDNGFIPETYMKCPDGTHCSGKLGNAKCG